MAGMFKNIIHKVRENIRYRSYLNAKNIYIDAKRNIFKEFNFSIATSKNDLNYKKKFPQTNKVQKKPYTEEINQYHDEWRFTSTCNSVSQ